MPEGLDEVEHSRSGTAVTSTDGTGGGRERSLPIFGRLRQVRAATTAAGAGGNGCSTRQVERRARARKDPRRAGQAPRARPCRRCAGGEGVLGSRCGSAPWTRRRTIRPDDRARCGARLARGARRLSDVAESAFVAGLRQIVGEEIRKALSMLRELIRDEVRSEFEAERRARPPERFDVSQAADRLGVSVATVRRRVKDGSLPVFRVGRRVLIELDQRPTNDIAEAAARAAQNRRRGLTPTTFGLDDGINGCHK